MKKIILGLAVSLDGLIEGPRGEYDWCFTDQDYGMGDFLKQIDTIFFGRKSFEMMRSAEGGTDMFAGNRYYIFSNTLTAPYPNTELVAGDVLTAVKTIKQKPGKNIWLFGGASLTSFFINHNLIDEYWLAVHPIVLGAGKPLFQHINERKKLNLIESKTYETGLVSLRYRPSL
jgi:dihydrofolate reductase